MFVQVVHESAPPETVSLPSKRKSAEDATDKKKQTRYSSPTSPKKATKSTTGGGEVSPSRLWHRAGRFLVCNLQAVQFSKQ